MNETFKRHLYTAVCIGGLCLLLFLFIGSLTGTSSFSKIHLRLEGLAFPIFISEIVLALCFMLLAGGIALERLKLNKTVVVLLLYVGWIFFKTSTGYLHGGALALRHAALFYYPLTAVLAYYFLTGLPVWKRHNEVMFNKVIIVLIVVVASLITINLRTSFALFNMSIILLIALWGVRHSRLKWVLLPLVGGVVVYSGMLNCTGRSHLVGLVICVIFLSIYFFQLIQDNSRSKYIFFPIIIVIVLGSIFLRSDKVTYKSLVQFKEVIALYKENLKIVQEQEATFQFKNIPLCLYHFGYCLNVEDQKAAEPLVQNLEESDKELFTAVAQTPINTSEELRAEQQPSKGLQGNKGTISRIKESQDIRQFNKGVGRNKEPQAIQPSYRPVTDNKDTLAKIKKSQQRGKGLLWGDGESVSKKKEPEASRAPNYRKKERTVRMTYVNTIFRFFIWRDMWEDFWKEKAFVLGIGFEKTQRSKSLEILDWPGPWMEDGWITPHNSFFHLIYRGGIVGLLLIIFIITSVVLMTQRFVRAKSVVGGLLVSLIIFGLVYAQFLVFLELPYTAIPFWFIFGVTLAYSHKVSAKPRIQ